MSSDLTSNGPQFNLKMRELSGNKVYEFEDLRLDADHLLLFRGEEQLGLTPKVVETLLTLIERHGEILNKDELMAIIWPDSIVEESNLTQNLYVLRKTLGNKSDGKPFIETLRRRGYRFNCDVHLADPRRQDMLPAALAPRNGIERDGNVLRVANWKPAAEAAENAHERVIVDAAKPRRRSRAIPISIAALLMIAITGIAVALYEAVSRNSASAVAKELTILRLTNGLRPVDAAVSPDGEYFAYHEADGETSHLWLQQIGQASRVEIGSTTDKDYAGKTFSPDGRFIYYVAMDKASQAWALYRLPSIGGPPTKLLDDITDPVSFSPGGDQIVFRRWNREANRSAIVIADRDGGGERIVLKREDGLELGPPAWSPDGKLIAFAQSDLTGPTLSGACSILATDPSGGNLHELSSEKWDTVYRIMWINDGSGLVAIATRAGEGYSTRRDQVYYVSYPAGTSRRLTTEGSRHDPLSLGVTRDGAVLAVPFNRSSQIWAMNAGSADMSASAVQLSNGLADGRAGLAPMPDGRIGYIARNGDALNIWEMNSDGSGARQLLGEPAVADELRADPRGRYFVFSSMKDGNSHLFRIDADGGNLKQLTFGDGNESDSTISPDGNWIVYDLTVFEGTVGTPTLWRASIDGTGASLFLDSHCVSPHYSPDGLLLSCIGNRSEVIVLSASDAAEVKSFKLPARSIVNYGAEWTPDGHAVTFIRIEQGFSNVWLQPLDGAEPHRLTDFRSGFVTRHAFSPDGSRLYVARGYPSQDAILISGWR